MTLTVAEGPAERPSGVPTDFAAWLREHEGREASGVIRIHGLDGGYVDVEAWAHNGDIRTAPISEV